MAGKVYECTSVITGQQFAVKEGLACPPDDFNGAHGLLNELMIMRMIADHP